MTPDPLIQETPNPLTSRWLRDMGLPLSEEVFRAVPSGPSLTWDRDLRDALARVYLRTLTPAEAPAQLFFRSGAAPEEWRELRTLLPEEGLLTDLRVRLKRGGVVIPRYGMMPHPEELPREAQALGSELIQPLSAFLRLSQEAEWVQALGDLTPATWAQRGWATVPETPHGWVVRGKYSSRKFRWSTHMRAPDREALREVTERLLDDPQVSAGGLMIREFIPLREVAPPSLNGLPVVNEWRFHWLGETCLGEGYYWVNQDHYAPPPSAPPEARALAEEGARRMNRAGFRWFSLDVAERADGQGWIIVEANSGEQSGLQGAPLAPYYALLLRKSHEF